MAKSKTKGKVAAASMSAGSSGNLNSTLTGKMIEDVMSQAHLDALASGVTDNAKILKLKLAARDELVEAHRKAEAEALNG